MPGTLGKITGTMVSASGQTVFGLIYGQAGTLITRATIQSITWTVTKIAAGGAEAVTGTGALTVSSVVFDTLQTTDPRYTVAGGYNFAATLPASAFAARGVRTRIDIDFQPVNGEPFRQVYEGTPI